MRAKKNGHGALRKANLLDYHEFFIRPHTGSAFVLAYDILDARTRKRIGAAREETDVLSLLAGFQVAQRFTMRKLVVLDRKSREVCSVRCPPYLVQARVEIYDRRNELLGYFDNKFFSLMGGFWVYDWKDRQFAEIQGSWRDMRYHFRTRAGKVLGQLCLEAVKTRKVTINWLSKTCSWYLSINKSLDDDPDRKLLLLGSTMAFDLARTGGTRG